MYKRRRISYLLDSVSQKSYIRKVGMKKSLPVECSSSYFSCIVADTFNFFVLRLSNEAAIVPKLLSKSNCGNKRCATAQWSCWWLQKQVSGQEVEKAGGKMKP